MAAGLPLMKNTLTPLAKSVLLQLGITAAALETDAATRKNILGSGMTTLNISNEEMEDIKILKSCLLTNGVSETIKNEIKEQKSGFLPMLLGTLAASTLGNMLAGRRIKTAGEGTTRPSQNF